MGKYTVYGEKVDKDIQKQLDKIINVIKKTINPLSIILIGGFGRGEGSIIYRKNKFIPINDYDIYVVTEKSYPFELIESVCEAASITINKKCINFKDYSEDMEYSIENTFYPDIRVLELNEFKNLPSFLKYYDLRYGATTIYGKDLIKDLKEISLEDIPLAEGWRFLMNRLSLMIMHFSPNFVKDKKNKNIERIVNFNMKTALSCAEALLFYSKKYVASYKKRSEILEKTYKKDFPDLAIKIPNLPRIVEKYTKQKLKPNYENIKNPYNDWFRIRNYSFEVIKYLLFKFLGKETKTPEDVSKLINKSFSKIYIQDYIKVKYKIKNKFLLAVLFPFANLTLNFLYVKRLYKIKKKLYLKPFMHPFVPPDLKIFAATIQLIFALNNNYEIDSNRFNSARKYLIEIYPDNPKIYLKNDWELMREMFGTIFNLYGFQRII